MSTPRVDALLTQVQELSTDEQNEFIAALFHMRNPRTPAQELRNLQKVAKVYGIQLGNPEFIPVASDVELHLVDEAAHDLSRWTDDDPDGTGLWREDESDVRALG